MHPSVAPLPKRTSWEVQRTVIHALLIRELKTRFGGKWLGALWVLAEPLAQLAFISFMLETIRGRTMANVNYTEFLITGIIPFTLFKNLSVRLMETIDANRGLFAYRQVKPMDAFVSRALLEVLLSTAVLLVVLAGMAWWGLDVLPVRPLEALGMTTMLVIAGFGTGLTLAIVTNTVPQARFFVRMVFWPLYFVSGVIYSISSLPAQVQVYMIWNPVLHALELIRSNFMEAYRPAEGIEASFVALFSVTMFVLGFCLYRWRRERLL